MTAAQPGQYKQHAYILLPVVLTLALLATIALSLGRTAAVQGTIAISDTGRTQARYLAEAGLNHAHWQTNTGNCSDYTTLNGNLAGHSYNVTISPASGSPVDLISTGQTAGGAKVQLRRSQARVYQAPANLTLQLGTQAGRDLLIDAFYSTQNYGAYTALKVSNQAAGPQSTLLYFDLSSLPAGVKILSAQLALYNHSTSGTAPYLPIDAYRLTRSWLEGSGQGTSPADGASWNNYDSLNSWASPGGDFDPVSIAGTATSADNNLWRYWDLTAQVAKWQAGVHTNYGLLLKSTGETSFSFISQENSNTSLRPRLNITYACECGDSCILPLWASSELISEGGLSLTTDGLATDRLTTDNLAPVSLSPAADNSLEAGSTKNYGTANLMAGFTSGKGFELRTLLHFDLSRLPAGSRINSAILRLYATEKAGKDSFNLGAYRLTQDWSELLSHWDQADAGITWHSGPGGSYDRTLIDSIITTGTGWYAWNLTPLVQEWVDGLSDPQGIALIPTTARKGSFILFDSKELSNKPVLLIDYSPP
ncbi:MAG: DNRLRE domain-containing protein [Pontibacterium sp.]